MDGHGPRILQVINTARIGGGMRHLLALVRELGAAGYVTHLATDGDPVLMDEAERYGARIYPLPMMSSRLNPAPVLRLSRLIREQRIDLVHTHGTRAGFYGGIACKITGLRRSVYTVHGFSFNKEMGSAGRAFYRQVERLLSRLNPVLISVSETDRRQAVETGICRPDRIRTIYNGVDLKRFDPAAANGRVRRDLGIPPEWRIVGVVSRLVSQKGMEYFLQAAARIAKARENVAFLVVGEGELRARLVQLASELGLDGKAYFAGARHDVVDYYGTFDVFVLSSLWEGQPIALIEALAMQCPTVATITSGSPEVVQDGETGLLVPPKDPEALAEAVVWCLDHPEEAQAMARRGREHVQRRFTVEEMVRRTLDVYRELLESRA